MTQDPEPYWIKSGHRGEWNCPHGVGHGNHVHGCCRERCCTRDDYPGKNDSFSLFDIPLPREDFWESQLKLYESLKPMARKERTAEGQTEQQDATDLKPPAQVEPESPGSDAGRAAS